MTRRPLTLFCRRFSAIPARLPRSVGHRAFSLIELVIVVVIIAVVAVIAVPRMSSAAARSSDASIKANVAILQRAIDLYMAEHAGRTPAHESDGSISSDEASFPKRLLLFTELDGSPGSGPFGPYIAAIPENVFNKSSSIRIDGSLAGSGTHGWRFDSSRASIAPDDAKGLQIYRNSNFDEEARKIVVDPFAIIPK